jgi:hypothetical protein
MEPTSRTEVRCLEKQENKVRFVPTLVHGFADYLVGLVVIGLPFLLGMEGSVRTVLMILGVVVILYSLMTDYELGILRFLRLRFHLLLDAVFGVVMLLIPSWFEVPTSVRWPFYLLGVLALVLVFTTRTRAIGTASTEQTTRTIQ